MRHPRLSKRKRRQLHRVNNAINYYYNPEGDAVCFPGTSTQAIQNGGEMEKKKELVLQFMNGIVEGKKDITPVIMGMKNGEVVIQELHINADGFLELPEDIKFTTKKELLEKQKVVSRILKEITPVIHADIETVVYLALVRKDKKRLRDILYRLNNKDERVKTQLTTRAGGCVVLEIGDYCFNL